MVGSASWRKVGAIILTLSAPSLLGSTSLTSNLDQRLLAAHNRERSAAGISALAWDDDLAGSAKLWADHLGRTGQFKHAEENLDNPEGENLWAGTKGYYAPENMVGLWVEEKKYFRRGTFPQNSTTGNVADVGHYTQLMWRRTTNVGCAMGRSRREDILVCRYSQAGNVLGQRPF